MIKKTFLKYNHENKNIIALNTKFIHLNSKVILIVINWF
jgi:hypothetical protein